MDTETAALGHRNTAELINPLTCLSDTLPTFTFELGDV